MSNEQLLDILTKFNDYLHISGMLRDIGRSILDWIVSIFTLDSGSYQWNYV